MTETEIEHVYCETCGACLTCDPDAPCFDYAVCETLPPSAHIRPTEEHNEHG